MTNVERERRRRGLTQTQLAALAGAGLHQGQVSLIERGRLQPTDQQAAALSRMLGVPPEELLEQAEAGEAREAATR